jgi:hypothetical protein
MWAVVTGAGLDEHPDDVSKESADLRQANLLSQVSHSAGGFTNLTLDSRNVRPLAVVLLTIAIRLGMIATRPD